jgi:hypothetical protein
MFELPNNTTDFLHRAGRTGQLSRYRLLFIPRFPNVF